MLRTPRGARRRPRPVARGPYWHRLSNQPWAQGELRPSVHRRTGSGVKHTDDCDLTPGERFLIRAVHHYADRIDDARLRADLRGLFGQEARHASAHEKWFCALRAHGFEIDRFLARYDAAIARLYRLAPAALRLAMTAAIEHVTATVADDILRSGVLDQLDPAMRHLFAWHAIEELEHKAVAFDVLAHVHPSYALRIAGFVLAAAWFGGFSLLAMRHLVHQEGLTVRAARRQVQALREAGRLQSGIKRGARAGADSSRATPGRAAARRRAWAGADRSGSR